MSPGPRKARGAQPGFRGAVAADLVAAGTEPDGNGPIRSALARSRRDRTFRGLVAYRAGTALRARGIPLAPSFLGGIARRNGIEIAPDALLAPGVRIEGPVVIEGETTVSGGASLGAGCRLTPAAGSSLGPILKRGVQIGAGATVEGELTLGNASTLAPDSVLRTDLPHGANAAGDPAEITGVDADPDIEIDGISYFCRPVADTFPSSHDEFCLRKPLGAIAQLRALLDELGPRGIVEVGVFEGGSAALIAQLARPARLLTFDITAKPNPALAEFAELKGFGDVVESHWGFDQADPELGPIVDAGLRGTTLDLVIDDASHELAESRATFDSLFPRLRPGGAFVLEDWGWTHQPFVPWPGRPPLTALALELSFAASVAPGVIDRVEITAYAAIAFRGEAELDPAGFSLRELIGERGRMMSDAVAATGDSPVPTEPPRDT